MENYKPLGIQVLVEPDPIEETSKGGIIIPEATKVKERPNRGTVISVGEKVEIIKPGDRILYGKFAGVEVATEEKNLLIMKQLDVFAIINSSI